MAAFDQRAWPLLEPTACKLVAWRMLSMLTLHVCLLCNGAPSVFCLQHQMQLAGVAETSMYP